MGASQIVAGWWDTSHGKAATGSPSGRCPTDHVPDNCSDNLGCTLIDYGLFIHLAVNSEHTVVCSWYF